MGESLLLITIITLVVLAIYRARPVILENPVTIQRPGKYHITLAPQLNRAQTFVEQIAERFTKIHTPKTDLPTQYLEVRDPTVFAKGESAYLLAIALRGGILYFQAVNPDPSQPNGGNHYNTLHKFSESVMRHHPLLEPVDDVEAESLRATINTIAGELKIGVKPLLAGGG